MGDAVASPEHYVQGHIEAIYAIEQVLGKEGFRQFCMGNYLKYAMRHAHKNGDEDLKKAETYLDWAVNGLPAPRNNRVPHKDRKLSAAEERAIISLSVLLQHELDLKVPGWWRVTSVAITPVGTSNSQIVVSVEDKSQLTVTVVLSVMTGEQYTSIVYDVIDELKKMYPSGRWA